MKYNYRENVKIAGLEKLGFFERRFLKVFCMKTEHESTTQKHMKSIPYKERRILLTTNLQCTKEKNTTWKMKMQLMNLGNHN